jgi:hypothetical protein
VKVVVYADESGTHDKTGKLPGSKFSIVAGFAAFDHTWIKFCRDWEAVLIKYKIPYFHFKEFADKKNSAKNPQWDYYDWSEQKRHDFLMELAKVAGDGNKIPIGGAYNNVEYQKTTENIRSQKLDIPYDKNPHKYCINEFFLSFYGELEILWPSLTAPITFFFDHSDDPEWKAAIHEGFDFYRAKDSRLREISFADKKQKPHLPLQAADMIAYRCRQVMEHYVNNTMAPKIPELDKAIFRNLESSIKRLYPGLEALKNL